MKDEKEVKQRIKVFVSGDMEREEKESGLMLKKVQDESFVE